ncbi:MAG: DUF378 domain-containing protein [Candidatus Nomurabacteria bacterium]|nr:MAG: DUF378 domain-containing protein [Candidatus Nomurabacteria bacterium]HRV76166.1 DUF378 domain-containing protein [Candidatus Saccharimonadales bacterium]
MGNKQLSLVSLVLVVVGALNWGLVGFFDYNLVVELADLVVSGQALENVVRVVYAVVGLAGVYQLVDLVNSKK